MFRKSVRTNNEQLSDDFIIILQQDEQDIIAYNEAMAEYIANPIAYTHKEAKMLLEFFD